MQPQNVVEVRQFAGKDLWDVSHVTAEKRPPFLSDVPLRKGMLAVVPHDGMTYVVRLVPPPEKLPREWSVDACFFNLFAAVFVVVASAIAALYAYPDDVELVD